MQILEAPELGKPEADPKTVASIILGGGAGTRLFPLTKSRAKPAVSSGFPCLFMVNNTEVYEVCYMVFRCPLEDAIGL